MEAEIREQPAVLTRAASSYARDLPALLPTSGIDLILIAARGSSDNAALYARYLFEISLGIPVTLAAPSVITRYKAKVRYPRCLCIGISQSGAAPDVSEVLSELRSAGHATLAITNTPFSRITQAAQKTLILEVGPEKSVAATKTYTGSLLALYEVARSMGGDLPAPVPDLPTEEWVAACDEKADRELGAIVRASTVFSLARGYNFSTAEETALKLMECALIPAKSYSTADFQHGPRALAGPGTAAIIYGDAPQGLSEQGCRIIQAPDPHHAVPEPLRPIWDVIFGQWIALHAARARKLEPDHPQHLTKVTETL